MTAAHSFSKNRNSTEGWDALLNSGLFYNLSAELVTDKENQSCLHVNGVEMPAVQISPNAAVSLSRRTGRPELSGGVGNDTYIYILKTVCEICLCIL